MNHVHPSNQSRFAQVPSVQIQRSQFDRSHGHKTTLYADNLYPVYIDEVLPGDTFNCNMVNFARLSTPIAPIMDSLYLDTFFFFVPNRLVWSNWVKFMGEKDDPDDTTQYVVPKVTGTPQRDDLYDHFGMPDIDPNTITVTDMVSALPFRAYSKVYDDWFRDQNLIAKQLTNIGDGPDSLATHAIRKRAKKHDYFTSALPWPQKGDAVEIPLGTTAPVWGMTDETLNMWDGTNKIGLVGSGISYGLSGTTEAFFSAPGYTESGGTGPAANKVVGVLAKETADLEAGERSGLYTDLSSATAATINSLREAFQLQKMLERDARSGNRYVETIKAHFSVTSPDFRLQRSEYLGGGSQMINITPVQQTAPAPNVEDEVTPLGTVGGFGTCINRSGFTKSFTEHGFVIGIANIRSNITYQQGINRMFTRSTKYDYYWPALANLGEQEVLTKELFFQGSGEPDDNVVFGYQERYAEYRYHPSVISGLFRSTDALTLDLWHLAQEFDSPPELTYEFIEANTPMRRVLAVPGEPGSELPHIIMDTLVQLKCARPMPVYSVPGLIDHF